MMYYQHQLPHHLILIIYVRAHWQQYEFLITQLQHSRMWACSKMHRFGTKWCTFVLSQADWTILWLQASVAWYYIHEQEGSVRQGKTCWSGTTWTSFSIFYTSGAERRAEAAWSHERRPTISRETKKPRNLVLLESAHSPLYITASSRGCLFARKQTIRKRYSAQPSSLELLSSHIVLLSAVLPFLLQAPRILCLLFPLQDRTGCTCSVFSKPRVGAKQGQRTHTITAKIHSKWRRTKVISVLARFPH